MKKYIDAEQLSKKIESIGLYAQKSADYNDGRNDMKMMVLDIIDSLQQESDMLLIPRWCLENIENTLRIQYNISQSKDWETCQDRNIKGSLNCIRKLLSGEELTGMERLEPYKEQKEQLEVDLEQEYKEYVEDDPVFSILTNRNVGLAIARHFYVLGLNTRKRK